MHKFAIELEKLFFIYACMTLKVYGEYCSVYGNPAAPNPSLEFEFKQNPSRCGLNGLNQNVITAGVKHSGGFGAAGGFSGCDAFSIQAAGCCVGWDARPTPAKKETSGTEVLYKTKTNRQ